MSQPARRFTLWVHLTMAWAWLAAGAMADCGRWEVGPGQRSAGPNGSAYAALQWDPDGSGPQVPKLVVGGSFSVAGVAAVNNIATWDGETWAPLGSGFNGTVRALAIYNNQLFAGGTFTFAGATACNHVARWTGTEWQPLGVGVGAFANDFVSCMTVYAGRLHVGGLFSSAGGISAKSVASWDGGVWRALGSGVTSFNGTDPGQVNSITAFAGNLVVGGSFQLAGLLANTRALAQWNGANWSSLGAFADSLGGFVQVSCLGVTLPVSGQGENLYVGGSFPSAGGMNTPNIARYNSLAAAWSSVPGGLSTSVQQLIVFQFGGLHSVTVSRGSLNGQGGGTYRYTTTSGVWNQISSQIADCYAFSLSGFLLGGVNGVSELIGSEWMPLGNGLNGPIRRIVTIGNDVFAAGRFTVADQQVVNGAARFDGSQWRSLGAGPGFSEVGTAASYNGQFVVGGFVLNGGTSQARVSRWDGAAWITMGSFSPSSSIELLKVIDGSLYVAANGLVFRWNGLGWQAVAGGPVQVHTFGFNDQVTGLVSNGGVLYAAAGSILHSLSGGMWVAIADAPPVPLDRWTNLNGRLIGASSSSGGPIYRWLQPGWETLLSASTGSAVNALAEEGGQLYAIVSNSLARFDGSQWSVLGMFTGGAATDISLDGPDITVSGNIGSVDGVASPMWARRVNGAAADYNRSGIISVQDIFDFLADYFANAPCADFNSSGTISVQDIFDYLAAYFAG